MKSVGLVLGLAGGIVGLIYSIMAMKNDTNLAWLILILSIIAIIMGAMAMAKPKIAGILMLIIGIVGWILVPGSFMIAGIILIVAGIVAIASKSTATAQ